ncbi:Aspartate aminotransferase [Monocercomonoides exilis]|uniref:Aspartate aminotransferase n=1 Tax=Monocercomonoides exilis TaxID=2049356 RepID=UPI00355A0296|nr:Aspartate aminotransferase [Monocercomonoides exilis]|eukprot:MONOS_8413.1-p1 / transcript=MONOS_8413.1 / gene=MONOS_8413 / organism=Monocercomonoides_exilis_PA203 / gene_product=Aspartate aminotransferase / transcript_product=Aspartate aminotransferase / location=Mono_scaffold00316:45207-47041(-) / protein_length=420 / sequence_SO=supercontig / SO=protein_coding / is_pseudo=false
MEVAPVPPQKVLIPEIFADALKPSLIRNLFEEGARLRKSHGDEVLDFSLGNPTLPPPEEFQKALAEVTAHPPPDLHSYMPNVGRPQTRAAIAAELSKWHNIPLRAEHFVLSCGAAAAISVLFHCIIPEDSEVIIIAPFFAEYLQYIKIARSKAVIVQSDEHYDLDVDAIEKAITPKTRAIIINSPNNPTGKIYSEATLRKLGEMLMKVYTKRLSESRDASPVFVVSDEPYRRLSYLGKDTPLPSIFNCYSYSFIVSSFSKDLSLPGERIGFIIMHPCLFSSEMQGALSTATRVLGFVNAPSSIQFAVERSISCDVSASVEWYKQRRDVFHKGLVEAGLQCELPEGAFYLFPRVPEGVTDKEFSEALKKRLVLAVPGCAFGDSRSVRFAYCCDMETIEKAIPRIAETVKEIKEQKAAATK